LKQLEQSNELGGNIAGVPHTQKRRYSNMGFTFSGALSKLNSIKFDNSSKKPSRHQSTVQIGNLSILNNNNHMTIE
jgi:hypothetical protein